MILPNSMPLVTTQPTPAIATDPATRTVTVVLRAYANQDSIDVEYALVVLDAVTVAYYLARFERLAMDRASDPYVRRHVLLDGCIRYFASRPAACGLAEAGNALQTTQAEDVGSADQVFRALRGVVYNGCPEAMILPDDEAKYLEEALVAEGIEELRTTDQLIVMEGGVEWCSWTKYGDWEYYTRQLSPDFLRDVLAQF